MKKLNLWLLASLFVAALTLTACSKDDDDKKNSMSLMGTWKAWDSMDETNHQLLTFNKDKTFSLDYAPQWHARRHYPIRIQTYQPHNAPTICWAG